MPDVAKPRVFIVDDERPIGRVIMLGLGLKPMGEHRFEIVWDLECPLCAGHGCERCTDNFGRQTGRVPYGHYPHLALERLCTEEEFDIIFLDISMPHMNGMVFFANLKLRAPARCNRVVIITGAGLVPAVAHFIEGRHTIEKPFSLNELESVVEIYAEKVISRGPR